LPEIGADRGKGKRRTGVRAKCKAKGKNKREDVFVLPFARERGVSAVDTGDMGL
jgi:hypothetical protein